MSPMSTLADILLNLVGLIIVGGIVSYIIIIILVVIDDTVFFSEVNLGEAEDHRVCANCGVYTDNFCIIEKGPPEENWIEDIWVKMGMLGKPICGECYYQ